MRTDRAAGGKASNAWLAVPPTLAADLRGIGFGYSCDLLVLAAFAVVGTAAAGVAIGYAIVAALHCVAAALASARLSRQLLPRSAAAEAVLGPGPQYGLVALVQVVFLALAPAVGAMFLAGLLVALTAVALRAGRRMALALALAVSLMLAALLLASGLVPELPHRSGAERAVVWLGFTLLAVRLLLLGGETERLRATLGRRERELQAMLAQASQLAGVDELTQVLNRRSVLAVLDEARERSSRYGAPLCVAMLDLDHFKTINDRFGHPIGDQVLIRFARIVQGLVRATDRIGRMGGEEFLLVLGETGELPARRALERLRETVAEHAWSELAAGLAVTVSAGLAEYRPGETVDQLLERADQALYDAKRAGRNRVRMH